MPSLKISSASEEDVSKPQSCGTRIRREGIKMVGVDELSARLLWRQMIAELIGTMLLVALGISSIIVVDAPPTVINIGLAFGLVAGSVILMIGHISGGHINPAVSIGLVVAGHIGIIRAACYVASQIVGAIIGAAIVKSVIPTNKIGSLGMTGLGEGVGATEGFILEALMTFLLLGVVCAVCDGGRSDFNGSAPLAIGLCIAGGHMAIMYMTGCSLNPARSFGPAVIQNDYKNQWVYWAGPITGGVIAGALYRIVFNSDAVKKQ